MQYLGLFFTFTFPGILVGILLAASKFFEDDRRGGITMDVENRKAMRKEAYDE